MTSAPISVGPRPAVDVAFPAASDVFEATLAKVPDQAWQRRSPCGNWTVRDIAGHVVGTMIEIAAIARHKPFSRNSAPPGSDAGDDPVDTMHAVSGPARDAVRSADLGQPTDAMHGRRTVAEALAFPIADLAVHAWDIAHATQQQLQLPDVLLAHVVHTCAQVPEEVLRGPGLFGPVQAAPDDADDTTRLMAWLGRETRPL